MKSKTKFRRSFLTLAVLSAISMPVFSEEATDEEAVDESETGQEVVVLGRRISYAKNTTSDEMLNQQSSITSALAVIDNLPGVLINEGDTFGSDDWSTTVSIRGFQLSLDQQQIGITVDGIANGNSNYGGGAKANRYIDTENLALVEVSQGTADVASRSNEALGGTLNFTTFEPGLEENLTISYSTGDFNAAKYFARYETGEIFSDTYAWVSISSTENSDWIQQTAENTRFHIAGKFNSMVGEDVNLTGYISYDDTHEDNYQRIGLEEFRTNPNWDRLTEEWTGVPYVDQLYRRGWSTLRENLFAYLKADFAAGDVDLSANVYFHDNSGRGDWVPPYLVDIDTVLGGASTGLTYFVNAAGDSLTADPNCTSSITFPYGGASREFDASCYVDGAIPVGSYRHTHYEKQRVGFNADFNWDADFGAVSNTLRGGIWYEDYERKESRDWHKIIDSNVGFEFDYTPYWVQYDRTYPVETTMFYLEDTVEVGIVTARLGMKQFFADVSRTDNFSNSSVSVDSDSDLLLSGGVVIDLPMEGLEAFLGYAENFAAVKDEILERDASDLSVLEPETAENIDLGLRYAGESFNGNITYYKIDFSNRLTFFPEGSDGGGINFLIGSNGAWLNTGGIESKGIEASVTYYVNDYWSVYSSFTTNDSTYTEGSADFPVGNTVFGSAENLAVVSFDWKKDKYFAGLSTKWVDERWLNADNDEKVDAYTVADFYAGVKLEGNDIFKGMEVRLTMNNVFDESYLGGIAAEIAWIGAPRTTAINFSANF